MVRKFLWWFWCQTAHCTTAPFRCSSPLYMKSTLSRTMDTFYKYTAYVIIHKKTSCNITFNNIFWNIIFRCNTICACPLHEAHKMNT
jgi:hypothetical protein